MRFSAARNRTGIVRSLFRIVVLSALAPGLAGILLSFYLDTPVGATIILISSFLFLLSWIRLRVSG